MLSIQNVHKSFGNVHAMDDVSLELHVGMFGLLGPNGAGKSTLMRTIATLQRPDEGVITYDGADIAKRPNAMRSTLGYLPQDFGVYPRMSAEALLDHIAILKGVTDKKQRQDQILSIMQSVNLMEHRKVSVSTFSGGMRQRFGVAQALLGDPKVLIVDEPTAGLDPFERQRFLNLLSEAGEDKIIILSTHIVDDVRDLCSDMAIMNEGKIIVRGAPEALIDNIRNKLWRKTVEKSEKTALIESHKVLATRLLQGDVEVSIYADDRPEAGFEPADPTLEDAYFAYLYNWV